MKKVMVSKHHLDNALNSGCRVCIDPNYCGEYYIFVLMDTREQERLFKCRLHPSDVVIKID